MKTPTEKEWLDVAGPHLCSGSYVYQLLDEEQKAGNVLRIQYFQDGHLNQRQALGLEPDLPTWKCSDPHCACGGMPLGPDSASCTIEAVELCSEQVTWVEKGQTMTALTNPYLRVKLATPIKLPLGTYCKKVLWAEDHVYAGCPDFIISREKFLEGVKTPLVSGQLVHMYYQDAVDPAQGKWYSGAVIIQQPYDHTRPSSLWEGVEVSWEDGTRTLVSPWELTLEAPPCLTSQAPQVSSLPQTFLATTPDGVQGPRNHFNQPPPPEQSMERPQAAALEQPAATLVAPEGGLRKQSEEGGLLQPGRDDKGCRKKACRKKPCRAHQPDDAGQGASKLPVKAAARQAASNKAGSRRGRPRHTPSRHPASRPPAHHTEKPVQGGSAGGSAQKGYLRPPMLPTPSQPMGPEANFRINSPQTKLRSSPSRLRRMGTPHYGHGISWDAVDGIFKVGVADLATGKCQYQLFDDLVAAARCHDKSSLQQFGEDAVLNFSRQDYFQLFNGSFIEKRRAWAPAQHSSHAEVVPKDQLGHPTLGDCTLPLHPQNPRRRLLRQPSASAKLAELGDLAAAWGPPQKGSATMAHDQALPEEEDWDAVAPPAKRAQQGKGRKVLAASNASQRASKRSAFKGVTLKNKRIAVMVWSGAQRQPIHLGYWPHSLAAARINDIGRLTLHGRTGVEPEQMNFSADDYTDEEVPNSIEALQRAIKLDQVRLRSSSNPPPTHTRQLRPQRRPKGTSSHRAPPVESTPGSVPKCQLRISHCLGVSWDSSHQMWQARFRQGDGTSHLIGRYSEDQAAGQAYDEYALQKGGGPAAVRNALPSDYTGRKRDDAHAHECLTYYALEGDSALLTSAAAPCPDLANGPAQATGPAPALDPASTAMQSTYVPGPRSNKKRTKAAASAAVGKRIAGALGLEPGPALQSSGGGVTGSAPPAGTGPPAMAAARPNTQQGRGARKGAQRLPDQADLASSNQAAAGLGLQSSDYKGVTWSASKGQWLVTVEHGQRSIEFGSFADELEAAHASDAAALAIGQTGLLNFPGQVTRVTKEMKQKCAALALHVGCSSASARSLAAQGPSKKGKVRQRQQLDELPTTTRDSDELPVRKAAKRGAHSSPHAHRYVGAPQAGTTGSSWDNEVRHSAWGQPRQAGMGCGVSAGAMSGLSEEELDAMQALASLCNDTTAAPMSH